MAEALVEATDHVKDEGVVGEHFAKSREVVGHLLQPAAVVGDREVALDEVAKARLKVDGASLPVAEELGLDGEPGMPGSGALDGDDLARSSVSVATIQGLTMQSIRAQSGEIGAGGSSWTWS